MSAFAGPEIVNPGLVLHLDAGSTRSYPGSGTTWTDLSGNGNNGSMSNVTYNAGNGGYMSFNGTTSIVDCGTSNSLYSANLTIEAMIYCVSFGGGNFGRIVDRKSSTIGYAMYLDNNVANRNGIKYGVDTNLDGSSAYYVTNGITLSTWQHHIVTHSGTSVNFYRNGSFLEAANISIASPSAGTFNCYIGNRAALDRGHDGRIAFIKIYNRALSAAEIRQNFNALRGRYSI